jgi:condensin complex subunit 1
MEQSPLEKVVILSFCKFMCISNKFCEENLHRLFELVSLNIDETSKSNIIVCFGDLFKRFTNLMCLPSNTEKIFRLLHDPAPRVRKNALMIITHLILIDILKCQGEIVDIVMLLDDPEQRIQDLVKLFLQQYNDKGQQNIYNKISVAITRLSTEFSHIEVGRF